MDLVKKVGPQELTNQKKNAGSLSSLENDPVSPSARSSCAKSFSLFNPSHEKSPKCSVMFGQLTVKFDNSDGNANQKNGVAVSVCQ